MKEKTLLGTLKYRKRDCDVKWVENIYDIADYVYKMDITTRKKLMLLFSIWKGPCLVVDSKNPHTKSRTQKVGLLPFTMIG